MLRIPWIDHVSIYKVVEKTEKKTFLLIIRIFIGLKMKKEFLENLKEDILKTT